MLRPGAVRARSIPWLVALTVPVGCGGGGEPPVERPMSVLGHEQAARAHDRQAASHERAGRVESSARAEDRYVCLDRPLADVPYSGGRPVEIMRPCWTEDPAGEHRRAAAAHRREAERHRASAADLVAVERAACAGIGEEELGHSPFFHRADVVAVSPIEGADGAIGSRVWFRRVPGLGVAWLRRAASCHHARAAVMGFSPTFQPYDPLAVPELAIDVRDDGGRVVVALTSSNPASAAIVVARASALVAQKETP